MTDLAGQRALILGGSSGIGLATAPPDHLVLSLASGRGAGLLRDLDPCHLRAVLEGKLMAYLGSWATGS